MTRHMELRALGFVSALTIAVAVPLTAQAGTLTIFNKNCTMNIDSDIHERITVNIDSESGAGCTERSVDVPRSYAKTIELAAKGEDGSACGKYRYKVVGALQDQQSSYDIDGGKDSWMTCKKDRSSSCQCVKMSSRSFEPAIHPI